MIRGFGYTPILIPNDTPEAFQSALETTAEYPFFILRTPKGATGPNRYHNAHQIPLKEAKTSDEELEVLDKWLRSYHFEKLFDKEKGFYA